MLKINLNFKKSVKVGTEKCLLWGVWPKLAVYYFIIKKTMLPYRKYITKQVLSNHLLKMIKGENGILWNVTIDSFIVDESLLSRSKDDTLLIQAYVIKTIPGTKGRTFQIHLPFGEQRPGNQKHIHVYAKNGTELYSLNIDGTAHDGYHGVQIPDVEADYFRSKGFEIPEKQYHKVLHYQ